jgi:hypothetical protein
MSHLFPVKVFSMISAMSTLGVTDSMRKIPVNSPEDGMTRLVLSSPEVFSAVKKKIKLKDFRVRFAFINNLDDFLSVVDKAQIEFYNLEGNLIEAIPLDKTDALLSCAIQVEIFQELLRAKKVDIPLL